MKWSVDVEHRRERTDQAQADPDGLDARQVRCFQQLDFGPTSKSDVIFEMKRLGRGPVEFPTLFVLISWSARGFIDLMDESAVPKRSSKM